MRPHEDPAAIITFLRWYVVVVAGLTGLVGTFTIWPRWSSYMLENQFAWLGLAALNLSAFYGCLELLIRGGPGGARTYVVAVAVTFAFYAVTHPLGHCIARWWSVRRIVRAQRRDKR